MLSRLSVVDALGLVDALFVLSRFAGVVAEIWEEVSSRFLLSNKKNTIVHYTNTNTKYCLCWVVAERKYTVVVTQGSQLCNVEYYQPWKKLTIHWLSLELLEGKKRNVMNACTQEYNSAILKFWNFCLSTMKNRKLESSELLLGKKRKVVNTCKQGYNL